MAWVSTENAVGSEPQECEEERISTEIPMEDHRENTDTWYWLETVGGRKR